MLSKKTQYAFQALMYLSHEYEKGPVLIADIARKKKIPLKFLENILLELKKAGILESKKGKGVGYLLKAHPSKTHVANVIRVVDGPISMLRCVSLYFSQRSKNYDETYCGLHDVTEK